MDHWAEGFVTLLHILVPSRVTAGRYQVATALWRPGELAWAFLLVFPGALLASVSLLPTTPSGALWWFSLMLVAVGYCLATGRVEQLMPSEPVGARG